MSVELLGKLSERFPVEDVKQRRQGGVMLDYISIDATIRRFNDVLGTEWSTRLLDPVRVDSVGDGKYLAVVVLELTALGKSAIGTGADTAADADKAIKTALAEAIKKAGHQYGVGLYLWEESERDLVSKQRKATITKAGSDDVTSALGSGSF